MLRNGRVHSHCCMKLSVWPRKPGGFCICRPLEFSSVNSELGGLGLEFDPHYGLLLSAAARGF